MRKLLVVVLLVLAGCSSAPPPEPTPPTIDFTISGKKTNAKPFLYCSVKVEDCKRNNAAMVKLAVPPGTAVRVTVPKEVADTPWSVVMQYKTATGEQVEPQTVATFAPGKETTFEAIPPGAGDQLQTLEVKQAGGIMIKGENGPEPVTRGAWSLQVTA